MHLECAEQLKAKAESTNADLTCPSCRQLLRWDEGVKQVIQPMKGIDAKSAFGDDANKDGVNAFADEVVKKPYKTDEDVTIELP